jgi:hypothetical protein
MQGQKYKEMQWRLPDGEIKVSVQRFRIMFARQPE